jgi:hypothetical protein
MQTELDSHNLVVSGKVKAVLHWEALHVFLIQVTYPTIKK